MTDIATLIARLAAATGPDREIDLAIALALEPEGEIAKITQDRRGFDGKPGMAWQIVGQSVCFEKFTADGRCTYNGGRPLPAYTRSLDDALTLLPAGTWWLMGAGQCRPDEPLYGAAVQRAVWLDDGPDPLGEGEHAANPALALCLACLRARAELEARG